MTTGDFQQHGVNDARLAVHATSHLPAWLWSLDGTRVLWTNPVGAALFGARNSAVLSSTTIGPADARRRQVVQLSGRLRHDGSIRIERLRGFGAPFGRLLACACSRIAFADGEGGVLIVAAESVGRPMPLVERLQRLVEGIDTPIAAFGRDGLFVGASETARTLMAFRNLSEAGLDAARTDALKDGRVETPIGPVQIVLQRVGSGPDVGLVALLAPGMPMPAPKPVAKTEERPAPAAAVPMPETVSVPEAAPVPEALPAPQVVPMPDVESAPELVPTPVVVEAPDIVQTIEPEQVFVDAFADDDEPTAESQPPLAQQDEPQIVTATPADDDRSEVASEPISDPVPVRDEASQDDAPKENGLEDIAPEDIAPEHVAADDVPADAAAIDEPNTHPSQDDGQDAGNDRNEENKILGVLDLGDAVGHTVVPELEHIETAPTETLQPTEPHPVDVLPVAAIDHATPEPPPPVQATPRRNPLRFTWAIDDTGNFKLRSDDFTHLIGPDIAARFGRPWQAISDDLHLDPEHRVAEAIASHTTWSGITINWPVDPPGHALPVELSGLPVFDAASQYVGYRGFGVVRDVDALGRLDAIRSEHRDPDDDLADPGSTPRSLSAHAAIMTDTAPAAPSQPTEPDTVDSLQIFAPKTAPQNVVPIRPLAADSAPALTPIENNAFNELARRLSARLDTDEASETPPAQHVDEPYMFEPELAPVASPAIADTSSDWLSRPPALAQGAALRDRPLLDLLPVGVLVYRLDRLLYANPHFLSCVGHSDLASLEIAGGLDALYVEPNVAADSSSAGTGTPVTIAAGADQPPAAANLSAISWDGEPAMALIFAATPAPQHTIEPAIAAQAAPEPVAPTAQPGQANAEDLAAILDTAAEGIVMFDISGRIHSCNRSAEALFGRDGDTLTRGALVDLFAPESLRDVQDYFDAVARGDTTGMHGREVLGRVPSGGLLPLAITMGRTLPDGPNFFAIFRDQSQARKTDTELHAARRQADRFVSAKTDLLARISHEIRAPLNAIIGFSDVMIEERFGVLGNDRYSDYIKDIRTCGARVVAIIDDLLDLSRIETGDLELAFASQNLNEVVEQCVAVMQPQANRERIIIRSSLAHHLPPVTADAQALRQIAANLISNSIHLANAGGQVIVSTALSDKGHVVLRVRDTGHGLNDNEIAEAMEPFRTRAPSDRGPETAGVNLSLTRALVEANRAQFNIKTAPQSGTLIEVVFAPLGVEA